MNTIVSPVKIKNFYLLCRDSSIILFREQSGSYIFNYNKEHGRGFVEAWDRFEIHTPGIVSCAKSEERKLQRVDGLTTIIIYSVTWHSVALDCYIDEDG